MADTDDTTRTSKTDDATTTPPASDTAATVRRARERIDSLAAEEGPFRVVSKDAGISPDPVTGVSFDTYTAAERARDEAVTYRSVLRSLDPDLQSYDLVVTRVDDESVDVASVRERTNDRRANGLPRARRTVTVAGAGTDEWLRVDNAPVVHFQGPDAPLDDEVVARQIDATLDP